MQAKEIPLHDIKPLLEIQDYSLYYLVATVILTTVIVVGIMYLLVKWYKNRNRYNHRKEYFKLLSEVDLNNAKKSAYEITLYGALFADDSPRHQEMFHTLTEKLEGYKYKKSVDDFNDEVKGFIELYKGMIDV